MELEIKSLLKFPIVLTGVEINAIQGCDFIGFLNQTTGQEIPGKSSYKIIGRFNCNNLKVKIKYF